MHIEAELDDIHSERLADLQRRMQKPLSEVLATVIDWAITHPIAAMPSSLPEPMSIGKWEDSGLSRDALYDDATDHHAEKNPPIDS